MFSCSLGYSFIYSFKLTQGGKGTVVTPEGVSLRTVRKEAVTVCLLKKNILISTPKVRPRMRLKTFKNLYAQQLVT